MPLYTPLLLLVFVVGSTTPQNSDDFFRLTVETLIERQDKLLQKFDELETNIKTQLQDLQNKLTLIENHCATHQQLDVFKVDIQQCATHQQLDDFKNIFVADECIDGSHRCSSLATCIDTVSNYMCNCMEGYLGDGITCQDINECESGEHMCHTYAYCTNTNGRYTCECLPGYDGDGYTCNDINECESGKHMCHTYANCTNTNGNHTCQCLQGYDGDGYTCNVPYCESPSQVIPGLGCIIPVKERKNWDLAQNDCHQRGGRLLEGIQREHLLPLRKHFKEYLGRESYSDQPWVGHRGGVWVKSRDPVPPIWKSGYSDGSDQQKNDCGRISLVATPPDLFDWNCSSTRTFLCQLLE